MVLGALAEAGSDTVSISSDLDANIFSVGNIRGLRSSFSKSRLRSRDGVELEIELLVGVSVAVPLVKILVVGGVYALVVGVNNFEVSSIDWGDSEMLSVCAIYGPVVVSVAVVASVSFQVEDLSVEGGDSPEVSVDLV